MNKEEYLQNRENRKIAEKEAEELDKETRRQRSIESTNRQLERFYSKKIERKRLNKLTQKSKEYNIFKEMTLEEFDNCCQGSPNPDFVKKYEFFKWNMIEGDRIWHYISPYETWVNLCGREGILLVSAKDEIVYGILVALN